MLYVYIYIKKKGRGCSDCGSKWPLVMMEVPLKTNKNLPPFVSLLWLSAVCPLTTFCVGFLVQEQRLFSRRLKNNKWVLRNPNRRGGREQRVNSPTDREGLEVW